MFKWLLLKVTAIPYLIKISFLRIRVHSLTKKLIYCEQGKPKIRMLYLQLNFTWKKRDWNLNSLRAKVVFFFFLFCFAFGWRVMKHRRRHVDIDNYLKKNGIIECNQTWRTLDTHLRPEVLVLHRYSLPGLILISLYLKISLLTNNQGSQNWDSI